MSDLCWDLPYHSGGWSSYLFCSGLQPCLYLPQHAQHVISAAWPPHTHRGHRTPASQAGVALPVPNICRNLTGSLLIPTAGGVLGLSATEPGLPDTANENRQCYIERERHNLGLSESGPAV